MDIYLQGMRDRSMRSGTELAWGIKLPDWSMAGNLSNRSSEVQIPRDICTRLKRYLYSAKCSSIIKCDICRNSLLSIPTYQLGKIILIMFPTSCILIYIEFLLLGRETTTV